MILQYYTIEWLFVHQKQYAIQKLNREYNTRQAIGDFSFRMEPYVVIMEFVAFISM